jgi:hypothetical protein
VAPAPFGALAGFAVGLTRTVQGPRLERRSGIAWNEATISPAGRGFLALANTRLDPSAMRSG